MNRREALKLVAAGTVTTTATSAATTADTRTCALDLPAPLHGPRMNFAQAAKVMSELELDALVLGVGCNVQHATGLRPVISRMGFPPVAFAVVSLDPEQPVTIVAPTFTYYYTLSDVHADSTVPAFVYGTPRDEDPAALTMFDDRGEAPVDALEKRRVAATLDAFQDGGRHRTASAALRAALAGLASGRCRIAVDHTRAEMLVAEAAPDAVVIDADDPLRRIRPVKSAIEIELMRHASAGNIAAAHEALEIARDGASYRHLRAAFFAAAARRGQRGVFMVVDRSSDEQFDAPFRDGQAFLIDCVSEYQGYHGDYGRTVFVGEPRASMKKATRAIADAWDLVREQLRPGLRFSEIEAMGQRALKQSGRRYRVPFRPHSVGLYHTDHVGTSGLAEPVDVVLEPGMIVSVDCPLLESGVGGSAHLEDLMLVTADGSVPIHATGEPVITV
ncbi:MAG: M24 family metallopeptidase [Woeseiaceae bacterium]|nr:M24 family metallopeptidase [Woeseiaceae bacterium]